MGYETIQVIAQAIENAGDPTDGAAIAQAIRDFPTEGIVSTHEFHPDYNHTFTYPLTIMQVNDGVASWYKIQQPQTRGGLLTPRGDLTGGLVGRTEIAT